MQMQITDPIQTIKNRTPAMCNSGPISWNSSKQSTDSASTMEAEYIALSDASREALARKQSGPELKIRSSSSPITILSDNHSTLDIPYEVLKCVISVYVCVKYV